MIEILDELSITYYLVIKIFGDRTSSFIKRKHNPSRASSIFFIDERVNGQIYRQIVWQTDGQTDIQYRQIQTYTVDKLVDTLVELELDIQ